MQTNIYMDSSFIDRYRSELKANVDFERVLTQLASKDGVTIGLAFIQKSRDQDWSGYNYFRKILTNIGWRVSDSTGHTYRNNARRYANELAQLSGHVFDDIINGYKGDIVICINDNCYTAFIKVLLDHIPDESMLTLVCDTFDPHMAEIIDLVGEDNVLDFEEDIDIKLTE